MSVFFLFSYVSFHSFLTSPSGICEGYLNNPQATRDAITPDGWFKTGDVAVVNDEGHFKIVDRKKELIKYKVAIFSCLYIAFVDC